ncbi:MAG TPA: hypothetical protein GX499_08515 [Clostridiales bacterium]|nr:hypothetical protein [Clostridiales bacterium]
MDTSKWVQAWKDFFSKDVRLKIIVLLGLIGMLMILISQFLSRGAAAPQKPPNEATASFTSEEYIASLESKLQKLVSGIDGVGRAEVMITLESGVEYVYAQEQKRNTDTTREPGEDDAILVNQKENVEQTYILVETEYGKREALVLTQKQPKIQGVVVVCEGADDIRVQEKVTSVVTTALGIPSNRVCVVKISQQ